MSCSATPGWLPVDENDIIAQVCESVRMPHAESVLKTVQKNHSSLPSCQPQHFRRRVLLPQTIHRKNPLCPFLRSINQSLRSLRTAGCITRKDPLGTLHEIENFSFHFCCPLLWHAKNSWKAKCEFSSLGKGPARSSNCRSPFPQSKQRYLLLIQKRGRRDPMPDRPLTVHCSRLGGGLLSPDHECDIFFQNHRNLPAFLHCPGWSAWKVFLPDSLLIASF